MPNGLIDQLSQEQVRDLFSYLMAPTDPNRSSAPAVGGK
jgi:hypothetical protein